MKLRIDGNSLRLRLDEIDLARFVKTGLVEVEVAFPGNVKLTYALRKMDKLDQVTAAYKNGVVSVDVPPKLAQQWAQSERVGFERKIAFENGDELEILVEKDLGCTHEKRKGAE